ncbi:hypothetical protein HYFRA_00003741 [Hymenoscyphus fraxineus]|uniref:Potassium transport protein n=1 Tax=Hymenoscyphus fraxineus TaxID=746836 RepID=A0A9N9PJX6_9HELO|nr:hypothetical protein HYFRA_00003741 [Hymenoscyphus fraxineus]
MFSIIHDVWHHIAALKPSFMSSSPHFNFITAHYFWIIGNAIVASICLYPNGNLRYIDALFLASGSATQSGLNTVDINSLNTWQQVVLYLTPMLTNPITVNSFVVFLRLYWFEKRFQHIAKEATKTRRYMSKTITKSKGNEQDIDKEEMGVGGRSIVVLHNTTVPNGMTDEKASAGDLAHHMEKLRILEEEKGGRSSGESSERTKRQESGTGSANRSKSPGANDRGQTQIKFADDPELRRPARRTHEEHIAILERQRKQDDGAVLRIPGPRDADAGIAPQAVDHSEGEDEIRQTLSGDSKSEHTAVLNRDDHITFDDSARPRNITIEEPNKPSTAEHLAEDVTAAKNAAGGALRMRRPKLSTAKTIKDDDETINPVTRTGTFQAIRHALTQSKDEPMPYLSWAPTVGRNSLFVDLTEDQREELGGIEYRSLKSLAVILTCYFWGFSLLGLVGLLPWIVESATWGPVVDAAGQGRVWWGFFTANSAFTDLGFTLTPDSMISFQFAIWPLLLMSFLIIIGNTGFPIMLRIIIYLASLFVSKTSGIYQELKFLLDHPRRCFTLLFPSKATWWLFLILIILNGADLVAFLILDLDNPAVTHLPLNIRFLNGWFQAASTRTAGFAVINLAELHPAVQVSYLVMMYISVMPIAMTVRRTNVYEEDSLGIYGSTSEEIEDSEPSYIGTHLRRQLSFDLWYIFLGFFIISISEGPRIQDIKDSSFTMFSVLFEIVSAYGTVGLSLGYTGINASFSAEFGVIAKLVIIAMQIRGRHRGLPYELDRAVLLPSEKLAAKEAVGRDDITGMTRSNTANSKLSRTNTKDRRSGQGSQNIFSTVFHPGPTIPNRYGERGMFERRHSIAAPPRRGSGLSRSVSPSAFKRERSRSRKDSRIGEKLGDGTNESARGRTEGRRSFFQEGVNPAPKDATVP